MIIRNLYKALMGFQLFQHLTKIFQQISKLLVCSFRW